MEWWRHNNSELDDPVVQQLPLALFKAWSNVRCLANGSKPRDILPDVGQIAFRLRMTVRRATQVLRDLAERGLLALDQESGRYYLPSWRQEQSGRPPAHEWRELREVVFARDDYTCLYCGVRGTRLECDHIVPVSRGGSNALDNLATACFGCNRSKWARTPEEWPL